MIEPEHFVRALKGAQIDFVCGVPDSLLKELLLVFKPGREFAHHIVHNEGAAIALAAGHSMASGKVPLVYMQNSGLGNAVNPLMSLAHPRVYGIPMILLIGHRGEPGKHDEPQHLAMGEATAALLKEMGIGIFKLDAECNPEVVLSEAALQARAESRPVAVLVSSGTFLASGSGSDSAKDKSSDAILKIRREIVLSELIDAAGDAAICSTTGYTSRELYELRKQKGQTQADFLNVGAMGHVSQVALGAALARPDKKVIAVDGDGSLLMHLGALSTIGQSGASNLSHLLINNGMHESVGGQPTTGHSVDFAAMARASGYKNTVSINEVNDLHGAVADLLESDGPSFLEVKVAPGVKEKLGRPSDDFAAARDMFSNKLRN